jgi:hypothetical protein
MTSTYCADHCQNNIDIYIHNNIPYIKYCCYKYYNHIYYEINKNHVYKKNIELKTLRSLIVVDFEYEWFTTFLQNKIIKYKYIQTKALDELEYNYMQQKSKKMKTKYRKYYKLHNKLYMKNTLGFIDIV